MDEILTDRVIDGINQTSLLLNGDTYSRRDYAFSCNINTLEAIVKEQYKFDLSSGTEIIRHGERRFGEILLWRCRAGRHGAE